MSAVRLPALQRFMCRLMWRDTAQRQGPALALAGAETGPVAHRESSAFELPDLSIVFAVPKSKRSKARIRMRRFYLRPKNGAHWDICPTCDKHRRQHYYCLDCFKNEKTRPGVAASTGESAGRGEGTE